jgi:hypothetical protein
VRGADHCLDDGPVSASQAIRAYYRLYCVNAANKIVGVEEAHCDDDASACAHAAEKLPNLSRCVSIEVWSGSRFVGRVPEAA